MCQSLVCKREWWILRELECPIKEQQSQFSHCSAKDPRTGLTVVSASGLSELEPMALNQKMKSDTHTWRYGTIWKLNTRLFILTRSKWRNSTFIKWVKVKPLSRARLFATLWTVTHQAPLSMGFSRQDYWSGLPFPSPGDLPNPGIEARSPALLADALTSEPLGKHFY